MYNTQTQSILFRGKIQEIFFTRKLWSVLILGLFLVGATILLIPLKAHAEEGSTSTSGTGTKPAFLQEFQARKATITQQFRDSKADAKNTFQEKRDAIRTASSTGGIGSQIREAALEKARAIRDAVGEKREDMKNLRHTRMEARVAERIESHIERMLKKFRAAVERMEKLVTKVESAIAKAEAKGKSVTKAKSEVAIAKTNIASAKAKVATIPTLTDLAISSTTASTTPRETMKQIKGVLHEAKELLKEAHRHLREAVKSIRGLSGSTATSTPTATTTGSSN